MLSRAVHIWSSLGRRSFRSKTHTLLWSRRKASQVEAGLSAARSLGSETPSHSAVTEQCVLSTGGGTEAPAREGGFQMRTHTKPRAGARTADEAATPAKQKGGAHQPKAASATKARKAARRSTRSSGAAASEVKQLVCRYCGSDDLAPSFRKRRDARCRTCFKQRYGSAVRKKTATRPREAKPAK